MNNKEYEAKLLGLPFPKPDSYGSLTMPVYNALAFEFGTAQEMEAAFAGRSAEHTYSRITNPTVQYFEQRVRSATDAHAVTALNSGMAAISNAFFTIAWSGSNIVTTSKLFGNTYSFFVNTLRDFGVEVRFCDLTNPQEVENALDENSCAVFVEIIANPQMEVVDLKALSEVAHRKNVPVVADTTLIPFTSFRASDFGVDIDVISSTKYISGGGTSLGGLIIDYGTFDWKHSRKLRPLADDHRSAFDFRLRKEIHRNLGAYMTAQTAYLQMLGLETMSIRYKHQADICLELAKRLQKHDKVKSVSYPGLADDAFHEISVRQFGEHHGAMLTFDLESKESCFAFLNRLKLIRRATNLFENRTLSLHPATTIYGSFTPEQRMKVDVRETAIRLSIGLEDADSLFEDLRQALEG